MSKLLKNIIGDPDAPGWGWVILLPLFFVSALLFILRFEV